RVALGGGVGGGTFSGNVTPCSLSGIGTMGNPLGTGGGQQTGNQGNRSGTGSGGGTNPFPGGGTGGGAAAPAAGAPSAISGNGFAGGTAVQISPGVAGVASESTRTSVKIYNE